MFEDKTWKCRECGAEFVFTASEQQFYADKGFQNEPGRCPACRAARLASFSAACSCRNLLSWRLPFRPSKYRRESGDLRPETAFYLYLLTAVTSPFVRNSLKGEFRIYLLSALWQRF